MSLQIFRYNNYKAFMFPTIQTLYTTLLTYKLKVYSYFHSFNHIKVKLDRVTGSHKAIFRSVTPWIYHEKPKLWAFSYEETLRPLSQNIMIWMVNVNWFTHETDVVMNANGKIQITYKKWIKVHITEQASGYLDSVF